MAQRRHRSSRRRGLSRREFLAGSAAAGVALGLPGWLIGCGDDGDHPTGATPTPSMLPTPLPVSGPREDRTFQFDLSFADMVEPQLRVLRSADDGMSLTPHTDKTRALFRERDPLLRRVSDQQLTHFATGVDLPSDSLQHFWVTGQTASGEAALLALQIHVPREVRRTLAAVEQATGEARPVTAKMRAYGLDAVVDDITLEDLAPALDEFVTPWDTATTLIFHHAEIMNLNLDDGPKVLDLIQTLPCSPKEKGCTAYLDTLAFRIAQHWPATTTPGGWATLVQATDLDGNPMFDDDGEPVYVYDLADETVAAAQSTVRGVLSSIFNNPRFAGSNWHNLRGQTVRRPVSVRAPQQNAFEVAAEHAPGTTVNGVEFVDVKVTEKRTVEVGVKNHFLRSHSVYVEYANEGGPLSPASQDVLDSPRAVYLDVLFTNDTLMGVPLVGDFVQTQRFSFDVPQNASKAIVRFGSLGVGGDPFCPEAIFGSVLTLAFNIGIPTLFLAIGAAADVGAAAERFRIDLRNVTRLQLIGKALLSVLRRTAATGGPSLARGIYGSAESSDATSFIVGLADVGLQFVLNASPAVAFYIATKGLTSSAASFALGPFALAAKLLSGAAALSEIVQSVTEVLVSPALFSNTLSLVMTTTVQLEHDPNDFRFPARARHYEVTLVYDQASKLAHKQTGAIKPGQVDPIPVVFEKVPSGGKVTVNVVLTTDEGYIIGVSVDSSGNEGPIGPIDNTPAMAGTIVVPIKERLIPLTQSTRYQHDLQLTAENGHRVWTETAAPTATVSVLCQGQDDRLCTLGGITISQRTGMAGYSFSAGGQGDRPYCGESGGGVMSLFQNVFLGDNPETGLKLLPCGFRHPAGIVYERLGPLDGRHFFFEPAADGASYFLESVRLDAATPFALDNPLTWGRFTQALESVAVVPTGYVVGVSRLTNKMEILQLPAAAVDRANAPNAVPFSVLKAGEGTREGLLSAPVAVAVRDATILVLETGNARIQAFDISGNPVQVFKNGTSATVELEKTPQLEYLDIAVEGMGYMYVLSATNSGLTVQDYRLDIFTPQGNHLARTTGVAAARLAVDTFRNVYTLNFATVAGLPRVEPSLSQWVPSTPSA